MGSNFGGYTMNEKLRLSRLVPRYTVPWLLGALAWQLSLYFLAKLLTDSRFHYDLSIALDGKIPFVPAFMLIYWGAYISWGLNYIMAARESREHCRRAITADMIAKAVCFVIFLLLPTTITRPEITGSGLFAWLGRVIYAADTPVALFPSIHCLDSWLCWRFLTDCKKVPRWYKWVNFVFSLLVCASTVLVKQHVFVDIFAGIAVAELGLFISRKIYDRKEKCPTPET